MNRNEYDARQYRLMRQKLDQYENGTIDLEDLVIGLDVLVSVLEAPDKAWVDAFRTEWSSLEIVRATRVGKAAKETSPDPRIIEEIKSMRRLLNDRLKDRDLVNDL